MESVFLFLNVSLAMVYLFFCERRIIPVMTLVGLNLASFGFGQFAKSYSSSYQFEDYGPIFQFLPLSVTFFSAGLLYSQRTQKSKIFVHHDGAESKKKKTLNIQSKILELKSIRLLNLVAIAFSVLHFLLVGLIVLQQNVETLRFESLGGSGLLGIPSRAVLFLLPITTATIIYFRSELSRYEVIFTVVFFMASRYFLGFKGGFWEALLVCFAAFFARRGLLNLKVVTTIMVGFFVSLLLAVNIGGRYSSLTGNLGSDYFVRRLIEIPGKDKFYGVLVKLQNPETNALTMDLAYFMRRYFFGGDQQVFPFDKLVSSEISGTERSLSSFLVSVTVGGDAYLATFLPPVIVFILFGIMGYFLGRASESLAASPSLSPSIVALIFLAIFNVRIFVQNGGLVYLLINNFIAVVIPVITSRYLISRSTETLSLNKL